MFRQEELVSLFRKEVHAFLDCELYCRAHLSDGLDDMESTMISCVAEMERIISLGIAMDLDRNVIEDMRDDLATFKQWTSNF